MSSAASIIISVQQWLEHCIPTNPIITLPAIGSRPSTVTLMEAIPQITRRNKT